MFALVVRFTVLPDHLEAFDALVSDTLVQIARHEPGTLVYVSHERSDRPDERVFYEWYQSADAFEFHEAQVHTIRFLRERGQHLVGPPEVWSLATLSGVINGELRAK
ncbi:MAG: antibiotic biosynthesis monooxygenase [Acidobacteria bacterium]|nr:antibiotic biosynthesis monooxygenase [Acidobacteriota bacterium]